MKKYIISSIVIISIILLQFSFFNFIVGFFDFFNPILLAIILVSLLYDLPLTLFWVIFAGIFIDWHSLLNFGVHPFSLFFMVLLVRYFFQKYVTNRTFYTFTILSAISTLFYYFFLIFFAYGLHLLNLSDFTFQLNLRLYISTFCQIIINSFFAGLAFFLISYFTNRLKANFILKEKF